MDIHKKNPVLSQDGVHVWLDDRIIFFLSWKL